jgi:Enoyl-(Acyl carrier protein) reductase
MAVTRSLATEFAARGVRVNAVAPGVVKTPMNAGADYEELATQHPLGRMAEISDIVPRALYLEQATFVTGETLHIARVVPDVSVLCPRTVARSDNTGGTGPLRRGSWQTRRRSPSRTAGCPSSMSRARPVAILVTWGPCRMCRSMLGVGLEHVTRRSARLCRAARCCVERERARGRPRARPLAPSRVFRLPPAERQTLCRRRRLALATVRATR